MVSPDFICCSLSSVDGTQRVCRATAHDLLAGITGLLGVLVLTGPFKRDLNQGSGADDCDKATGGSIGQWDKLRSCISHLLDCVELLLDLPAPDVEANAT